MGNGILTGIYSGFSDFIASPYKSDMNAPRWIAFIGLLILAFIFWSIVLHHLKGVAE